MIGKLNLFKLASLASSLVFLLLFLQLLFTPAPFVRDLGLSPTETTSILGRRVSMFMLGIAVLSFVSRNLPHSSARQGICASTGTTLIGIACMSAYELNRGTVNSSMWFALTVESTLGLCFWAVFFLKPAPSTMVSNAALQCDGQPR